ncbi:MAG TPA: DUF721 domain-containing protein [Pyrinomonadaceae bacterium]|nr:DUF721 domain-containing protein [Pyrinomonadaceae bacterium]
MEQVFGAIPSVLNGLASNGDVDEAVVFAAWKRCAGELLNDRTNAIEFFENRLIVAVADETWRRHLEDLSPQMLYKINSSLGDGTVRFIEFRIDEKVVDASRERETASTESAPEVSESLTKAAEAISDAALRQQFLGAAAEYLERQKKD